MSRFPRPFLAALGLGLALAGVVQAGDSPVIGTVTPTSLYLRAGTIDASRAPAGGLGALALAAGPNAKGRHFVLQLNGPMTPARRAALLAAGVGIGDYLPMNAYIVTLDGAAPALVAQLAFVRWYSEYRAEWKLDPELSTRLAASPELLALRAQGKVGVVVTAFAGEPVEDVAREIWALPGAGIYWQETVGLNAEFAVEINAASVAQLAALPGVQFIEPAPEAAVRNISTRWIVQSNVQNVRPLYDHGLHGEGQIVGILDEKINVNHCSFKDTVPIGPTHRKIVAYNTSLGSGTHGTHVGGIVAGDANVDNAETRGVAYLGKIAYNVIPAFTEQAVLTSLNLHHSQGARVHTNSWGNDGTTAYDGLCRGFDSFQYSNEDDLVCLAVTNQSLLKNPENAKNLLAVGNSGDTPNQATACTGGAGPTSDGRRKPEIYAPGCNVQSANAGTTCGTTGLTGTSMASPAVAGVGMMVRQYFTEGYYPSGAPSGSNAFTPTSALIKGVLLNSAVDMTGVAGYPSNKEGWGRVLADNAVYFPGDARKLVVQDRRNTSGLSTGNQVELPINVTGSDMPLRVTAVWTEPPAAAGASFASINDLDLEVVAPGGALYKGNVFSNGFSATGGNKDDRNNVEQVHVNTPPTGAWTVRIKAAAVNQGMQGYAIVVTGNLQGAACYVDCDGNGALNINDFICFQTRFALGDAYADCDGNSLKDINDFICFQTKFAIGCQ